MKLTHCVLLSSLFVAPFANAQEPVSWADFTKMVRESQPDRSLEYTVVTKSGMKQKTRQFLISPRGVALQPNVNTPPEQIVEVQVRHRGRLSYFGWVFGKYPCEQGACLLYDPVAYLLMPIDLAFGAAATPPMLAVEGTRRLVTPVKVYKIVP